MKNLLRMVNIVVPIAEFQMDKSTISSWVRQARHRAKKHDIYNSLTIEAVEQIISDHQGTCAYCGVKADTLDHPFPLKDEAPNAPANILPSCKSCKDIKKNNDLVWMFSNGRISKEKYVTLLEGMLKFDGGPELKKHVKKVTGMSDD